MRAGVKVIWLIGCAAALVLLRRCRGSGRAARPTRAVPTGLEHLTDHELHHAWTHTTRTMASMSDPGRRLAVVITRQHLLDELTARGRSRAEGRDDTPVPPA